MTSKFKEQNTFKERQDVANQMLVSHPRYIPIICEKAERSDISEIQELRFLISPLAPAAQLIWLIRSRIKLSQSQALFIFVGETLVSTSAEIGSIHKEYKDEDGLLYVVYAGEETFGYLQAEADSGYFDE